jgi:hypothetical protein
MSPDWIHTQRGRALVEGTLPSIAAGLHGLVTELKRYNDRQGGEDEKLIANLLTDKEVQDSMMREATVDLGAALGIVMPAEPLLAFGVCVATAIQRVRPLSEPDETDAGGKLRRIAEDAVLRELAAAAGDPLGWSDGDAEPWQALFQDAKLVEISPWAHWKDTATGPEYRRLVHTVTGHSLSLLLEACADEDGIAPEFGKTYECDNCDWKGDKPDPIEFEGDRLACPICEATVSLVSAEDGA